MRWPRQRVYERAKDLGQVGIRFLGLLNRTPWEDGDWPEALAGQAVVLDAHVAKGGSPLSRAAASVLCCNLVIQVSLSEEETLALVDACVPGLESREPGVAVNAAAGDGFGERDLKLGKNADGVAPYGDRPVKPENKQANLRFGDVYRDALAHDPEMAAEYRSKSKYTVGWSDNQAAAAILACAGLRFIPNRVELVMRLVNNPKAAKALSSVMKSLGLNMTRTGAALVEADCLQGRGVGIPDLAEKTAERTGTPGSAGSLPRIDGAALRNAVQEVLRRELMGKRVEFDALDHFWDSRWSWCVNGGHSRRLEQHDGDWRVSYEGRVHRRVAMESWIRNPMYHWSGDTIVSPSLKYENGKTRVIFACDTVSYVRFEHMLRPIEKAWRNDVVLLDPGRLGHGGMADRVRSLGRGAGLWLMMDYDDFNSQHTLDAQKMVIEEAARFTGYPPELADRLVSSFDNMWLYHGTSKAKATATLMSGHRGTTFINSVLNRAYILAVSPELARRMPAMHTGDDIVANAGNYESAEQLVLDCNRAGLRLNPIKQSIGRIGAEFLRVTVLPRFSRAYALRAVAASVVGNWVSPVEEGRAGKLRTFISNSRTLMNRFQEVNMWRYFRTSAQRRTRLGSAKLDQLLKGTAALRNGPVFSRERRYMYFDVFDSELRYKDDHAYVAKEATIAYLARCTSDVERLAMEMTRGTIEASMVDSSYAKTLQEAGKSGDEVPLLVQPAATRVVRGIEQDDVLRKKQMVPGLLAVFPLMHMLRARLSRAMVIHLLSYVGWDGTGHWEEAAWGSEGSGAVVDGIVSYSDACFLTTRAVEGVIKVTTPAYV